MQIDQMVPLLPVANMTESLRFYTEVLPFRAIQQVEAAGQPVWALLACKSIRLMIQETDADSAAPQDRNGGNRQMVLYFYVPDARRLRETLGANGHAVGEIERERFGMDAFTLRDPDGHTLAFASPLVQIA